MFNFSGILYRVWGVSGVVLLLGVICICIDRPWRNGFSLQKQRLGVILIAVSLGLAFIYGSRIISPSVSSYTGEFVESHRNSRVAPPLPLTYEYVFWNGSGKKPVFYLDTLSAEKIILWELEPGQMYTIFYDELTNIIVKVELSN